jgi:membrane fusion protein (multidrug efflux system)
MSRRLPLLLFALLLPNLCTGEQPPARVVTGTVKEMESASTSRLMGIVDFERISEVSGEVSGLIMKQLATEGARFKAGDPLVELNTDLIRKDMDIKRKQRSQVTADLEKVGKTLQRLESLLQKNSASRQAYDDSLFDYRSLEKKRETLDEELERLKLQLEKSVVRSPFDGVVLEKLKESGEWINPGTAVCRIASTRDLLVKAAVSEHHSRFQRPGSKIPVEIPALELELEGEILGLVPVADLRSKSATLKVAIPYRPGMLQNMSAAVEIPTSSRQRLQMIPRDALVRFKGQDFVYTVVDGKARMMPIEIIARTSSLVGVNNPRITTGMPVVVEGNDRLKPDQAVQVIRADGN